MSSHPSIVEKAVMVTDSNGREHWRILWYAAALAVSSPAMKAAAIPGATPRMTWPKRSTALTLKRRTDCCGKGGGGGGGATHRSYPGARRDDTSGPCGRRRSVREERSSFAPCLIGAPRRAVIRPSMTSGSRLSNSSIGSIGRGARCHRSSESGRRLLSCLRDVTMASITLLTPPQFDC